MIVLKDIVHDPSGIVDKIVFEDETAIAETVVYKYQDRGVICFSVQSGCPIGCAFCGTGKKFIRNLSEDEMKLQIETGLKIIGPRDKIQIMSMSMGEPMLNWNETRYVMQEYLNKNYYFFVSTVGLRNYRAYEDLLGYGERFEKFGLQFSLHAISDEKRKTLLPNWNISSYLTIQEMIFFGGLWKQVSKNPCYYNYICAGNETEGDAIWLANNLKGLHLTCSVMCNTGGFTKANTDPAIWFANEVFKFSEGLVSTKTFDPAGQDTVGGGCGQLLYVQEKLKSKIP
jgi:23S rRNA (adenine2503-C2)-methyltransferase